MTDRGTANENRRLRVIVLDEELPYPANSGKRIRTLNLLTRLAKHHDITYLCHRNRCAEEVRSGTEYLVDHGIRPVVLSRSIPEKSGAVFYARLAGNLLSSRPYSVQIHGSRELRDAVRNAIRTNSVDLFHVEWTPYADCIQNVRDVPWVVMAHNIESLIWRRYHESEVGRARRWYIAQQWRKFEQFERNVFASTSRLVTVSQADARMARDAFGATRVDVVDNGVDIDFFHPQPIGRDPQRMLFLGSLDWRPNQDAVTILLDDVFPKVVAMFPSAKLDVVGRNPPDWLFHRAAASENVTIHANVPDVRPFLYRSGLMVVPLRIGGGSRLKILEALATACPVVSTHVGAEGLDLTPGTHFFEVGSPSEMPQAVLSTFENPRDSQAMALAGRQQVTRLYAWDLLAERLNHVWRQVVHDPLSLRSK